MDDLWIPINMFAVSGAVTVSLTIIWTSRIQVGCVILK